MIEQQGLAEWFEKFSEEIPQSARIRAGFFDGTDDRIFEPSGEWILSLESISERYIWQTDPTTGDDPGPVELLRIKLETESIDGDDDQSYSSYLEIEIEGPGAHNVKRCLSDDTSVSFDSNGRKPVDLHEAPRHRRVVGLDEQRDTIQEFLSGDTKKLGVSPRRGLLLQGPPGTGKTEIVIDVCQSEFGGLPVVISGPEILNKWVGESERILRQKFEDARHHNPTVLYIDELDAIGGSRDASSQDYATHIVAQLLVLMDGIDTKIDDDQSLKVIASTNRPEALDSALLRPGRFGNRPVQFDAPDINQAEAILHFYLERVWANSDDSISLLSRTLEEFVKQGNESDVRAFVKNHLSGLTGAEIEDLVAEAVRASYSSDDSVEVANLVESYQTGPYTADYSEITLASEPSPPAIQHLERLEESLVTYTDTELPHDVQPKLNAYAGWLHSQHELDRVVYRALDARLLVGNNNVDSHAYLASRLTPPENGRVCLGLRYADRLVNAANYGVQSANQSLQVLHEYLARWDEENLLIIENPDQRVYELFPEAYSTEFDEIGNDQL